MKLQKKEKDLSIIYSHWRTVKQWHYLDMTTDKCGMCNRGISKRKLGKKLRVALQCQDQWHFTIHGQTTNQTQGRQSLFTFKHWADWMTSKTGSRIKQNIFKSDTITLYYCWSSRKLVSMTWRCKPFLCNYPLWQHPYILWKTKYKNLLK